MKHSRISCRLSGQALTDYHVVLRHVRLHRPAAGDSEAMRWALRAGAKQALKREPKA